MELLHHVEPELQGRMASERDPPRLDPEHRQAVGGPLQHPATLELDPQPREGRRVDGVHRVVVPRRRILKDPRPGLGKELGRIQGKIGEASLDEPSGPGVARPVSARNVCVALGNWLSGVENPPEEALTALIGALADPEPLVRGHAAWALGRAESDLASSRLSASPSSEDDPWVREELVLATGE